MFIFDVINEFLPVESPRFSFDPLDQRPAAHGETYGVAYRLGSRFGRFGERIRPVVRRRLRSGYETRPWYFGIRLRARKRKDKYKRINVGRIRSRQ